MKDHVTVVPSDRVILVNGEALQFDADSFILMSGHDGVHAIQWHEGKGHIEFEDGSPNKEIKGKADYKSQIEYYVGLFDKETARLAKEKEEAEKAAEEFYNSEEQRWVRLRTKRNELIAETDYLMMEDYPITDECRAAFEGYRQALRDITSQDGAPWTDDTIPWPAKPEIVKKEAA
jgi:hypothetical protein